MTEITPPVWGIKVDLGKFSFGGLSYHQNPDTGNWEPLQAQVSSPLTNALDAVVTAFENAVLSRYGNSTKEEIPVSGLEGTDLQISVSLTKVTSNPTDGRIEKLLEIVNGDAEFAHQLYLAVHAVPYNAWSVTLPKLSPTRRQFWAAAIKKYATESQE